MPQGRRKKTGTKAKTRTKARSNPKPRTDSSTKPAGTQADLDAKIMELAEVNRQLRRKIFDLYTIFEISRNFSAVLDYKTLLDSFIFTCLGQVGVGRGALFLKPHNEATEYRLAEAKGSDPLPDEDAAFLADTRLVKYLTGLNRPLLVDELAPDISSGGERQLLKMFKGGMIVPLIYRTRLAGLFLLAEKVSQNEFNSDEIEFISALGNQIAVAIENARLYAAEKAANEHLWEAQQQLVRAERLAALGEVSAKVAHEVNNPLGIIKNYLLLMKRYSDDGVKVGQYVGIVDQEIDRIALIVEELRRFQRPANVEFGPLDLAEVLEATLVLTERQMLAAGVRVERKFDPGPFRIKGNSDHLRQVFLNMMLNARSAMENGGTLTITMTGENDKIILAFDDTGPGIDFEHLPLIFEPFFTTKGEEGSGLGLSISAGIIKSHGGSINFMNTPTGGRFEIKLPRLSE